MPPAAEGTQVVQTPAAHAIGRVKSLSVQGCLLPACFAVLHATFLLLVFLQARGRYDPFADCSVLVPAVGSIMYLGVVFLGPRAMNHFNVPALELTETMWVYNLYQTLLNGAIVVIFVRELIVQGLPLWGLGVDRSPRGVWLSFGIWMHYNDKFVEYLDSVFMVLRRKQDQLSFLHWYHHVLMGWAWYAVVRFACGGDAYFGAIMNSLIHVVMYSYYMCRAVGITVPWKQQVTNLQMVQFVVCASHSVYLLCRQDSATIYPPWLSALELFVMLNMLVLFSKFYKTAYSKKKSD